MPDELFEKDTYLKRTPFVDLLLAPVPFHIPMSARFQHHWIVALARQQRQRRQAF